MLFLFKKYSYKVVNIFKASRISFYMPEVVSSNPTHDEVYWIQYYVIKCDRSVVLLKPPRYNCNIVESGVKHDNPHFTKIFIIPSIQNWCMFYLICLYAWLYVLLYTIVDFKSSLELVLYVWFISTLNKALNWIELKGL
jgi:hypothetical protein